MHSAGTPPVRNNIQTIATLEAKFQSNKSSTEAIADGITSVVGTLSFVIWHVVVFAGWIVWNSGKIPGLTPFDPFPFVLMTLMVSFEGVILATFVLIKQNGMARASDRRDHLNLQVDLLAEQEVTKVLQAVQRLCAHFGIEEIVNDPEAEHLAKETAIDKLARHVDEKLTT